MLAYTTKLFTECNIPIVMQGNSKVNVFHNFKAPDELNNLFRIQNIAAYQDNMQIFGFIINDYLRIRCFDSYLKIFLIVRPAYMSNTDQSAAILCCYAAASAPDIFCNFKQLVTQTFDLATF